MDLSGPVVFSWLASMLCVINVSCSNDFVTMKNQSLGERLKPVLEMFSHGLHQANLSQPEAPVSDKSYSLCLADLYKLGSNFKALDAFGKPDAGLYEGDAVWLGNYDECLSIVGFNYCLANLLINATKLGVKGVPIIDIRWGLCTPVSCSNEDLMRALQYFQGRLELKYPELEAVTPKSVICSQSPPISYNAGVICTIVLLSVLGGLMIIGSLYDEWLQFDTKKLKRHGRWLYCALISTVEDISSEDDDQTDDDYYDDVEPLYGQEASRQWNIQGEAKQESLLVRFFLCFAVTRNLSKLLDTRQKDTSIGSLNGIRVISMTWVILGHTLFFSLIYYTTQNGAVVYEWSKDFGFQAILNAFFAVDSFFFLSGLLVSFLTLSRMQELRSVKAWVWFYFHRYWRLTPVLGLTILVWMFIQPFFGDSPVWYTNTARTSCEKYWWTTLLYINNFYPQGFASQCVGWAWYLANDMQFFIISPFLLAPLFYAPVIGWIALVSLSIVCMAATVAIMVSYDASVDLIGMVQSQSNGYGLDDNSLVYEKPYCRIGPYLVGIGLGFIMHRIGNRKVKMSPFIALTGWLVAAGIAISVLYGLYPTYHKPEVAMSRAGEVAYGTLSRYAWGVALAWVTFACKYGYGGWINNFLSWTFWVPLARLTYSAYLFHPIVLMTFYLNFGTPIYESRYLMAYFFAGNLLLSYVIALFVALAVEYPFAALEKLFMPNNPKEKIESYHRNQQNLSL
ncbi:nose resistant to fluoxetine protein 6-like [Acanthaster planci]|uniref:Nose resistant to fluoxetine protein 6-like n=1 Tax=Acanthaster planci TaxID=133434 RepID=A0A8B7YKS2_ACAPL|nr:nose resistant to fluoxetine protein 6-like [Acanthaster planci]XP_022092125.1 nose resistant to fluoxetine protein 6-like [Acanthaster planci]XP_022092126.1 nose resistant to fluoxetine protein 6-like [Acanthaster planci]